MKRIGGLFNKVCDIKTIELADKNARKGKHNWGIIKHDRHREEDNKKLLESFKNHTYKTSEYSTFIIHEPKERVIYRLPYYPDRVAQWSLMLVLEPIWTKTFITNTYSCIKGRGIHKLVKDLKRDLTKDPEETKYCLKLDIRKFYPSIDHEILKTIIRRKLKDKDLLIELDKIIDSTEGVPIGNYLSQFFANLYLTYFDHWIKEVLRIKYYYRYADDITILSDNKESLHRYLSLIKEYLENNLKLYIKPNYQVFPIEARGVDFVGYVFYHHYILLRKSIKLRMYRLFTKYSSSEIDKEDLKSRLVSYFGWLKYCNSKHLLQNIEDSYSIHFSNWNGTEDKITNFKRSNIRIIEIIPHSKYFSIHFISKDTKYSVRSTNKSLFNILSNCEFPINFKL